MEKRFLFLATADEDWLKRNKERLSQEFDLNVFRSASACQAALNDRLPEALLLDTTLEGGYDLHKAVKDDFMTSDVYQILFCSEEEAGRDDFVADDFLVRPGFDTIFWQKMVLLRRFLHQKSTVTEQLKYAQNVALTAMSSMGELGVVMQFLSHSFECHNPQAVAMLAAGTLKQYELEGVVQLRWEGDGHVSTTSAEEPAAEDMGFIDQMRTLGRIMEIGKRLVVNYDHASILITNMPDDTTQCGRIRDNIATLCEGVEARMRALLVEQDNRLKQQGIRFAVNEIRESVRDLKERQIRDIHAGQGLINQVIDEFEEAFIHTGLLPEVENQLISQLVNLRQKVIEVVADPGEVDAKLKVVVNALETLAGEVNTTSEMVLPDASVTF